LNLIYEYLLNFDEFQDLLRMAFLGSKLNTIIIEPNQLFSMVISKALIKLNSSLQV